jgi:RNA recognition motif-containing protein
MSMKLFVGGLSFSTDNEGLRRGFESFGEVEDVAVIMDRDTGRSRGFGFVTFREREAAMAAIAGVDGHELDGRTVRVNEAAERAPRAPRSFGGNDGGGFGGGGGGYGGGGGGGYGGGGGGGYGGGGGGGGRSSQGGKGKSRRGDRSERW